MLANRGRKRKAAAEHKETKKGQKKLCVVISTKTNKPTVKGEATFITNTRTLILIIVYFFHRKTDELSILGTCKPFIYEPNQSRTSQRNKKGQLIFY